MPDRCVWNTAEKRQTRTKQRQPHSSAARGHKPSGSPNVRSRMSKLAALGRRYRASPEDSPSASEASQHTSSVDGSQSDPDSRGQAEFRQVCDFESLGNSRLCKLANSDVTHVVIFLPQSEVFRVRKLLSNVSGFFSFQNLRGRA